MNHLVIVLGLLLGTSSAFVEEPAQSPACTAAKAARREAKQNLDACLANFVKQRCGGGSCLVPQDELAGACPGKRQKLADAKANVAKVCGGGAGLEPG